MRKDTKEQLVLGAAENIVYLVCEHKAKGLLEGAGNEWTLIIWSKDDAKTDEELVECMIKNIAAKTSCKKVQRKVVLTSDVLDCVRSEKGKPDIFRIGFRVKLPSYIMRLLRSSQHLAAKCKS